MGEIFTVGLSWMSRPLIKEKTHLSWQNKHSSEESIHEECEKRCRAGCMCALWLLRRFERGCKFLYQRFCEMWPWINYVGSRYIFEWIDCVLGGGVATVPTHPHYAAWVQIRGSAQGNVKSEMRSHGPHMCCPLTGPHTHRGSRPRGWSDGQWTTGNGVSEGAWRGNKDLERERRDDEENKEHRAKASPSVLATDGKVSLYQWGSKELRSHKVLNNHQTTRKIWMIRFVFHYAWLLQKWCDFLYWWGKFHSQKGNKQTQTQTHTHWGNLRVALSEIITQKQNKFSALRCRTRAPRTIRKYYHSCQQSVTWAAAQCDGDEEEQR